MDRWLRPKRSTSIVPVRVVETRSTPSITSSSSATTLIVTAPNGLRVHGLDLDTLSTILARLG